MKYIKSIVVLALLIGLPAGSWYFLQHGLDWRRVKRTELSPKQDLKTLDVTSEEMLSLKSLLDRRTTLVTMKKDYASRDLDVIEQFKDAYTFQSLLKTDLPSSVQALYAEDYLLIDTAMVVRQVYQGTGEKVITRIVEDIALMVPHKKEKDIKMRSKNEN